MSKHATFRPAPVEWEKQIGVPRKWVIYALGPLLLYALHPEYGFGIQCPHCLTGMLIFGVLYGVYTLLVYRGSGWYARAVWYAGLIGELSFVGVLIFHSGGLQSPLKILYALTVLGIVVSRPRLRDLLWAGVLAHVSYTLALYFYYDSLVFYTTFLFWLICVILGLVFLAAVRVAMLMEASLQRANRIASELEAKNRRLEELAVTDELTGLYNRKYFLCRLEEEVERVMVKGSSLVLLMIDVDNFRDFNERYGQDAGDAVLADLATLVRKETQVGDVVCRYGGEEFTVIMPEQDGDGGYAIATQISKSIMSHLFKVAGTEGHQHLSVSIGAATFPSDATTSRELINQAENALFMARQTGSGSVQCYYSLLAELEAAGVEEGEKFWTTLETLITVIDAKDKYTRGHSERVAEYVMELAREYGLPEAEIRLLGYAGFLHDIGKIEIERGVLNKEGHLTLEEWEVIRKHPVYGATIVEPLPKFREIIPIIKHHHERYDGKGYPDGLQGEAIPLGARILALADGYDAMHSHRPYRRALATSEVLAEIRRCAGTQFDPYLAEIFVRLIQADEITERSRRRLTGT